MKQRLGRICRAYGVTPSQYVASHTVGEFFFDEDVTSEWNVAAAQAIDRVIEHDVDRLSKKGPEQIQVVIGQWLARIGSR